MKQEEIKNFLQECKKLAQGKMPIYIEKFETNCDYDTCIIINEIMEKENVFTAKEWEDFYQKNKNNTLVLLNMMKTGKLPVQLVEKMLINTKIIQEGITDFWKQDAFEKKMLKASLRYNLSEKTMDKIASVVEINSFFPSDINSDRAKSTAENFSDTTMKYFCDKVLENKNKYSNQYDIFLFVRDRDYIESIIDKIQNHPDAEKIVLLLLNNHYLEASNPRDEQILNKVFDIGCDPEYITRTTPYIDKCISEMTFAGFVSCINPKTNVFNMNGINATSNYRFMSRLLDSGKLSTCYHRDLSNRLVDMDAKTHERLIMSAFINTDDEVIIQNIDKIKGALKTEIYMKNNNIPEDMVQKYAMTFAKKIMRNYEKDKEDKTASVWYDYLSVFVGKAQMPDNFYDFFIDREIHNNLFTSIATSDKTPDDKLKKIISKIRDYNKSDNHYLKYIDRSIIFANFNLLNHRNMIDKDIFPLLNPFIDACVLCYNNKDCDNIVNFENKYGDTTYGGRVKLRRLANEMVKRNITIDKTGIDELLKTPDISDVEKYTLLSMKILLEKYIQQEKEELNKENIKTLPPQKQPDNVLIENLIKTANDNVFLLYSFSNDNAYKNLIEVMKTFNEFKAEIDKRNLIDNITFDKENIETEQPIM